MSKTISAISTAPGTGGVAIIRVSGADALNIAEKMFRPLGKHKVKDFELNQSPNAAPCLSNRVQLSTEIGGRFLKTASRQLELSLQKEQDTLNKISEIVAVTHSLKCSSLRIRAGHWVYVLRKIII